MWHLLYATGSSGILFWLKQKWIGPGVINKLQNFSFKLRLLSKTENCNMTNFIDFHQKFKLLISRKASKQIKIGSNFFFNIKLFLCKFTPHHIYLGMYKNRANNERKFIEIPACQQGNPEQQNTKQHRYMIWVFWISPLQCLLEGISKFFQLFPTLFLHENPAYTYSVSYSFKSVELWLILGFFWNLTIFFATNKN